MPIIQIRYLYNKQMRKIQANFVERHCQNPQHQNRAIQIVCLQDGCKNNRLLCLLCMGQSHRLHNTIILHENIITPLHNLKQNCQNPQSNNHIDYFAQKFDRISKECQKLQSNVNQFANRITNQMKNQFHTICRTFDKGTFNSALEAMKGGSSSLQQVENYVQMIKFLQKRDFSNIERLKTIAESIQCNLGQAIIQAKFQISAIMDNLYQKMKFWNFLNPNLSDGIFKNDPIFKNDDNKMKDQRAQTNAKQRINKQEIIQGIQSSVDSSLRIQIFSELPDKYILEINNLKQLNEKMLLIPKSVKSLTIITDSKPYAVDDQTIKIICTFKKLKRLDITWAYTMKKAQIMQLLSELSKLQQLTLSQCCQLDKQCIDLLIKRHSNIKKFHYGCNYLKYFKKLSQDSEFIHVDRYMSLGIQDCIKLDSLKRLQTLWVTQCDTKALDNILGQMKNLKQIALGAMVNSSYFKNLKTGTLKKLSQRTSLLSISLTCLKIKQSDLLPVFQNNQHLDTIVITECLGITDLTVSTIYKNCHSLKQLCLLFLDEISGKYIWNMKQLQTLVLSACWGINLQLVNQGIKNLTNLKFLNISYNDYPENNWVTNQLMLSIKKLIMLNHLSIQSTPVSNEGLKNLGSMKQLTTLLCGKTKISGFGLRNFCAENPQLTKISIGGLNSMEESGLISSQDIQCLQRSLNHLTHLNIWECSHLDPKIFKGFRYLECLSVSPGHLTQQIEEDLINKGVWIFQTQRQ